MTDRIRTLEAFTTSLALPAPLRVGPVEIARREYAAVRVETADGLVGKAFCLTREAPVAACVEKLLAPCLRGSDADLVAARWEDAFRSTITVGRTGLVLRAIGLVDIALWDIKAQRAGLPLWRLLGGYADRVPLMIVAEYPAADADPSAVASIAAGYAHEGHRLVKIARAPGGANMSSLIPAITDALPSGSALVVDAGFAWRTADEALSELESWSSPALAWLEDPLVPEDIRGCARIRSAVACRLGVGDELTDIRTYAALLGANAVDVLRADVVAVGGITRALQVLELGRQHGVPVSFHVYPEISVHLAAGHAGDAIVEAFDPTLPGGNPFDPAHRLVSAPLERDRGTAVAGPAPGLGFDLDWELLGHACA